MKRPLFVLIPAVFACWGCTSTDHPANTSISGYIESAQDKVISLSMGSVIDSVTIAKDGSFEFTFPLETHETGMILIEGRFLNVYAEPGKNLTLSSSLSGFPDKTAFGGDLGAINKYLQLARKLDQQTAISQEELYVLEPDQFIQLTDSIREIKLQLLKEYVMRYPEIDSAFVTRHKTDIAYAWATQRLIYPGYYAIMKRRVPDLPDQYHTSYLAQTEINNPNLLVSTAYQGFLANFLDYKQALYLKENPTVKKLWFPESVARFRVIQEEFTDSIVKDFVLYTSMSDHLDDYGTEHLETFLTNFQLNCHNPDYQNRINEKLEKLKTLQRGSPAPDFTALNPSDEPVSLKDFQGNLLYINLWASWSPWSIQEFPHWESLIRKFDNQGVHFISISLDFTKDIKNWKYIIREKNLQGTHLIQDPKSSVWQDKYFINDLPRYLLIDAEGKIISVHAPRPSENMEQVLQSLLNQ